MQELIGKQVGDYLIEESIGSGNTGQVFRARDEKHAQTVALKVIRPDAMQDPAAEQEIERRFKRELLLARQVTHRNVVRIYDLEPFFQCLEGTAADSCEPPLVGVLGVPRPIGDLL